MKGRLFKILLLVLLPLSIYGQGPMLLASIQQNSGGCSLTAGNLFPTGNAASECTSEADSTSGWLSAVSATMSSVTGGYDGTYAIQGTMSSGGNGRVEIDITVSNGVSYDVGYWYKVTGATTRAPGVASWTGVTTSPTSFWIEDNAWHYETFNVTANSTTMRLRFYVDRTTGTGTGTILVDKVIVTPS